MQNLAKRKALAEQLRWLIGGRITNDAFDDFLYDEDCLGSNDRTLDEIAWWAWTLYSDTSMYKLVGKRIVNDETRKAAIRAIVFLRGENEYRWPSLQESFVAWIAGPLLSLGCFASVILLLLSIWMWKLNWVGPLRLGPVVSVWALAGASVMLGFLWLLKRTQREQARRFEAAGDTDCWPFMSTEEVAAGSKRGHLLAP